MSDERLGRIETTLEQLVAGQADLKVGYGELRTVVEALDGKVTRLDGEVTGLRGEVTGLHGEVTGLRGEVTGLRGEVTGLHGEVKTLDGRVTELTKSMDNRFEEAKHTRSVLHEDLIGRIRAMGEPDAPTIREMRQGFSDLHEAIDRRLKPLELAVTAHSRDIKQLQRGQG